MLQTNPPFMAKLLKQLGGCAAIKEEFLGASKDARCKEGTRALISLRQAIQVVFRGLLVDGKPPEYHFSPRDFHFNVLLFSLGILVTSNQSVFGSLG